MKILTVCFVCLFLLSSCSMFDGLLQRMQVAEDNLNKSQNELDDARKEFDAKQADVDARQTELENAIAIGDLETAKLLSVQVSAARADAKEANDRVKEAEKDFDQLGDLANAAKYEYDNSTNTWDYISGIIVLLGGFFGVGGIVKGVTERQRRKIAEENQLNPRPNTS